MSLSTGPRGKKKTKKTTKAKGSERRPYLRVTIDGFNENLARVAGFAFGRRSDKAQDLSWAEFRDGGWEVHHENNDFQTVPWQSLELLTPAEHKSK